MWRASMVQAQISVLISTLNQAANVAAAIASVRTDAEVTAVDGGSHDCAADVALGAGACRLHGPRVVSAGALARRL